MNEQAINVSDLFSLVGKTAGVAIYLASRAGAYVNGAVITVDGGACLK